MSVGGGQTLRLKEENKNLYGVEQGKVKQKEMCKPHLLL